MRQVAAGEPQAFEQLLQQFHAIVYRAAYRLLADEWLAEDIVQEVFLKVWLRRTTLAEISHFSAWLKKVTENQLYDHLRKRKLIIERPDSWQVMLNLPAAEEEGQTGEENHFQELLQQAVSRLPDRQRRVFELIKKEGYSREEAARELAVSPETIKTNLEYAIRSIRAFCLDKLDNTSILVIFSLIFEKYL